MESIELINLANEARKKAYAPYSGFFVGAALLSKSGNVYCGCNIENSSYSSTICAERTAFVKAISEGEKEFSEIAIVGGSKTVDDYCYPCGICRQFMTEFCNGGFLIHLFNGKSVKTLSLDDILPYRFDLN